MGRICRDMGRIWGDTLKSIIIDTPWPGGVENYGLIHEIIQKHSGKCKKTRGKSNKSLPQGGAAEGAAPLGAPPKAAPMLLFDFPRNFSQVQFWADA